MKLGKVIHIVLIPFAIVLAAHGQTEVKPDAQPQAAASQPAASQPDAAERAARPEKSPVVSQGCRIVWDVPYVAGGHEQQRLDIYCPAGAAAAPVVMFVHGGEWTKGNKYEVAFKPKLFNDQKILFVSVNYRLSGVAHHPAQVDDVAAAVRWVHDHISDYGGDPANLVLMGHSAGCHIVTLVGLDPRPLAKVDLKPGVLKAVVSWSGGAFDLVEKVRQGGMYAGYIRTNFEGEEKGWRDASPMAHVGDAKPMPAFLMATGEGDRPESQAATRKMVSLIQSAGGKAEFLFLSGKDHYRADHDVGIQNDPTSQPLLDFIHHATARATPSNPPSDEQG